VQFLDEEPLDGRKPRVSFIDFSAIWLLVPQSGTVFSN
jgi:hypothetical protein